MLGKFDRYLTIIFQIVIDCNNICEGHILQIFLHEIYNDYITIGFYANIGIDISEILLSLIFYC